MQKNTDSATRKILVCLSLFVLLLGTSVYAVQTDEELKKKYALILGEYEFDLTDLGMGVVLVDVYVEYGSLWALPEVADSPGEMLPVEGKEFEFTVEDPESGTFFCAFLKDEEGKYTKFHLKNEMMGMDVIGKKMK